MGFSRDNSYADIGFCPDAETHHDPDEFNTIVRGTSVVHMIVGVRRAGKPAGSSSTASQPMPSLWKEEFLSSKTPPAQNWRGLSASLVGAGGFAAC